MFTWSPPLFLLVQNICQFHTKRACVVHALLDQALDCFLVALH